MRIGVTGASGFIGSKLVEKLLKEGHGVVVFGRKNSFPSGLNFREYARGDIDCTGLDLLVHLAGSNSEDDAVTTNVTDAHNIAKSCSSAGLKKVFFASSYAVYGSRSAPASESEPPNPCSNYGLSKYLAEETLRLHPGRKYQLATLRFSSVFGSGNKNGAPHKFMEKILAGEQISSPNLRDMRQFIHVDDATDFIVSLLKIALENTEVINVSGNQAFSTLEIVRLLESDLGKKAVLRDEKSRSQINFLADNSKAVRLGLRIRRHAFSSG